MATKNGECLVFGLAMTYVRHMSDFDKKGELQYTEERTIRRLSVKNFFASILEAFNLERGAIYTLKRLFTAPGHMVLDYIGAGRYKYVGPFKLLVISTALALLAISQSELFERFSSNFKEDITVNSDITSFFAQIQSYVNLIIWAYIPIVSLFSWALNKKLKLNYAENLAFHTYFFVLSNIFTLMFILDFFISNWVLLPVNLLLFLFFYTWMYKQFFNKGWLRSWFELIGIYAIGNLIYLLVLIGAVVSYLTLFPPVEN